MLSKREKLDAKFMVYDSAARLINMGIRGNNIIFAFERNPYITDDQKRFMRQELTRLADELSKRSQKFYNKFVKEVDPGLVDYD